MTNSDKVEIYVATHKKIDTILPDYCRLIQINAERTGKWEGYLHDNDTEDNISLKNSSYSELTALYSLWKGSKADYLGMFKAMIRGNNVFARLRATLCGVYFENLSSAFVNGELYAQYCFLLEICKNAVSS